MAVHGQSCFYYSDLRDFISSLKLSMADGRFSMISVASVSGSGRLPSRQGTCLWSRKYPCWSCPGQNLFNGISAPAAFGISFWIGFGTIMAVFRVIALNKALQIGVCHRMLLEGKVDIGSQIIEPHFLCLHLRAGGGLSKKRTFALTPGL